MYKSNSNSIYTSSKNNPYPHTQYKYKYMMMIPLLAYLILFFICNFWIGKTQQGKEIHKISEV